MNAMIAFLGGVRPDPGGVYVHVQAKQMTELNLSTGNSKNHCTAWRINEENWDHEHTHRNQQDVKGGEGEAGARATADTSKG